MNMPIPDIFFLAVGIISNAASSRRITPAEQFFPERK
jgi:hypothetical protein